MSSNTDTVKIWGAKTARSLRPIWMAEELEIDDDLYEKLIGLVEVSQNKKKNMTKKNRKDKHRKTKKNEKSG